MKKKAIVTTLQAAITLALLYWVFHDPVRRADMAASLRQAHAGWLVLGFVLYGFAELAATWRWQWLLRVQGVQLSHRRVFALVMIGLFFNFFIPGGTGGDVVKIFYLLKETHGRRSIALLSVIVDRVIGLLGIIALAGVAIALRWDWLVRDPLAAQCVWAAVAVLAGSLLSIVGSFAVTKIGLIHKTPARMPMRAKLIELHEAYGLYGRAWGATTGSFALSILSHLAYFSVFVCGARAYGASAGASDVFAIMPIVGTISALPISLGGIGVREKLFEIFLGNLAGVPEAVAVLISSTGYLLMLGWGLVGGAVYLAYRPSEHARMREIREEVRHIEEEITQAATDENAR